MIDFLGTYEWLLHCLIVLPYFLQYLMNAKDLFSSWSVTSKPTLMIPSNFIYMDLTLREFVFTMALPAHSGRRPLIQFHNNFSQTVGPVGRVISPSQGPYLNTGQYKHAMNAYTHHAFMPWVGFEPTIPASERAKTVHVLDRAATVTGLIEEYWIKFCMKLRAVISHDNYYTQFYHHSCELVQ
jgi:hypothetical protein